MDMNINNCIDCPLLFTDFGDLGCSHPKSKSPHVAIEYETDDLFKHCPLKEDSILQLRMLT